MPQQHAATGSSVTRSTVTSWFIWGWESLGTSMSWKPQLCLQAECGTGTKGRRGAGGGSAQPSFLCPAFFPLWDQHDFAKMHWFPSRLPTTWLRKPQGAEAELPSKPRLRRPGTGRHGNAHCTCQGFGGFGLQRQAGSPWHDHAADAKGISFDAILGFQEEGVFHAGA